MAEFFKKELIELELNTGLKQYDRLMEKPSWEKDLNDLVALMVKETEHYKIVKPEVLQRVIHDAMMNDDRFIGFNAAFVRKALNAWWGIYGGKIIEARDQKEKESQPPPTPVSPETQRKIDEYVKSLLTGGGMQMVPDVPKEEAKTLGKEWTSGIERKAILYPKNTEEQIIQFDLHRQWIRENFHPITGDPLPTWISEKEWLKNKGL